MRFQGEKLDDHDDDDDDEEDCLDSIENQVNKHTVMSYQIDLVTFQHTE
jgi:hypothetical protein